MLLFILCVVLKFISQSIITKCGSQFFPNISMSSLVCKFVWGDPLRKTVATQKQVTYTTTYPSNVIMRMKFQTSEEVSAFLFRNAGEIGFCKWNLFGKETIDQGRYMRILYRCRYKDCQSFLEFWAKKTEEEEKEGVFLKRYYLSNRKINNTHNHNLKLTRKLAQDATVKQYLYDLPVEDKFEAHVQNCKERFKLTKCQAKYLKDRIFWKFRDEDHMLSKLSERKVNFRRKINNAPNDEEKGKSLVSSILLLVSDSMRKNYSVYGQLLCFDITYKLLMRRKNQQKSLGVGFFIGSDENSRILLFGISTIKQQNSQNFAILFSYFFQMMGSIPETILTDDQKALGYAMQRLKRQKNYSYVHLLDWYHKMQALKKILRKQRNKDDLFSNFVRLLKEPSIQVFNDIVRQIAAILDKQHIMKDFLKDRSKYCLSQSPQKFFAFGIASTRAQAFNGLIKRSVPHQTNIGRLVFFVLRVEKRLNGRMTFLNYIHPEITKHIQNEQVQYLFTRLECLAAEQLRQYYQQARAFQNLQKKKPTHGYLHYCIPYLKYSRPYKFNLFYDIKYNCWRCECKHNFRTGMPCSHIVRAVLQFGGCLGYYINQRWIHAKEGIDEKQKKAVRPSIRSKRI